MRCCLLLFVVCCCCLSSSVSAVDVNVTQLINYSFLSGNALTACKAGSFENKLSIALRNPDPVFAPTANITYKIVTLAIDASSGDKSFGCSISATTDFAMDCFFKVALVAKYQVSVFLSNQVLTQWEIFCNPGPVNVTTTSFAAIVKNVTNIPVVSAGLRTSLPIIARDREANKIPPSSDNIFRIVISLISAPLLSYPFPPPPPGTVRFDNSSYYGEFVPGIAGNYSVALQFLTDVGEWATVGADASSSSSPTALSVVVLPSVLVAANATIDGPTVTTAGNTVVYNVTGRDAFGNPKGVSASNIQGVVALDSASSSSSSLYIYTGSTTAASSSISVSISDASIIHEMSFIPTVSGLWRVSVVVLGVPSTAFLHLSVVPGDAFPDSTLVTGFSLVNGPTSIAGGQSGVNHVAKIIANDVYGNRIGSFAPTFAVDDASPGATSPIAFQVSKSSTLTGVYLVKFNPTTSLSKVAIRFGSTTHIPGSPFLVRFVQSMSSVVSPAACVMLDANGSPLGTTPAPLQANAGDTFGFPVATVATDGRYFTVSPPSPVVGKSVIQASWVSTTASSSSSISSAALVSDNGDGTFSVGGSERQAGTYQLHVYALDSNGRQLEIQGSPFALQILANSPYLSKTTVTTESGTVTAGSMMNTLLMAHDSFSNPMQANVAVAYSVTLVLSSTGTRVPASFTGINSNSQQIFSAQCQVAGTYTPEITLNGELYQGGLPHITCVAGSPSLTNFTIIAPFLVFAGQSVVAQVEQRDVFGNKMNIDSTYPLFDVFAPDAAKLVLASGQPVNQADQTRHILLEFDVAGSWPVSIGIQSNGSFTHISGSPFTFSVSPLDASTKNTVISGPCLLGGIVGTTINCSIVPMDRLSNVVFIPGLLFDARIYVEEDLSVYSLATVIESNGAYSMFFTVTYAANYRIAVRRDSAHIRNSPYVVTINPGLMRYLPTCAPTVIPASTGLSLRCIATDQFGNLQPTDSSSVGLRYAIVNPLQTDSTPSYLPVKYLSPGNYTINFDSTIAANLTFLLQFCAVVSGTTNCDQLPTIYISVIANTPRFLLISESINVITAGITSVLIYQQQDDFRNLVQRQTNGIISLQAVHTITSKTLTFGPLLDDAVLLVKFATVLDLAGLWILTARVGSLSISRSINVVPTTFDGPSSILTTITPSNQVAGLPFTFRISPRDKYGNSLLDQGNQNLTCSVSNTTGDSFPVSLIPGFLVDNKVFQVFISSSGSTSSVDSIAKTYRVDCSILGLPLSGSPMTYTVLPGDIVPSASYATGSLLAGGVFGYEASFQVIARDRFLNIIQLSATDAFIITATPCCVNGIDVLAKVALLEITGGNLVLRLTPPVQSQPYTLTWSIKETKSRNYIGDGTIAYTASFVQVLGVTNKLTTTVEVPYGQSFGVGLVGVFQIVARSLFGQQQINALDTFEISVIKPDGSTLRDGAVDRGPAITPSPRGLYTIRFTSDKAGWHQVMVQLQSLNVPSEDRGYLSNAAPSNPFKIFVAFGNTMAIFAQTNPCNVLSICSAAIYSKDLQGNVFPRVSSGYSVSALLFPPGAVKGSPVTVVDNGTLIAATSSTIAGMHQLAVALQFPDGTTQPMQSSPISLFFDTSVAISLPPSRFDDGSPSFAFAGEPTVLVIDARDKFGNRITQYLGQNISCSYSRLNETLANVTAVFNGTRFSCTTDVMQVQGMHAVNGWISNSKLAHQLNILVRPAQTWPSNCLVFGQGATMPIAKLVVPVCALYRDKFSNVQEPFRVLASSFSVGVLPDGYPSAVCSIGQPFVDNSTACVRYSCYVGGVNATITPTIGGIGAGLVFPTIAFIQLQDPPQITSSRINALGTSLDIYFDRDTNMGLIATPGRPFAASKLMCCGGFDCGGSSLDLNTDVLFGSNSSCSWASPSLLRCYLSPNATALPGTPCRMSSNTIMTANVASQISTVVFTVKPPAVPPVPVVVLQFPSVVPTCSDLVFNASSSYGGAGRSLQFTWKTANNTVSDFVSILANLTKAANRAGLAVLMVPRAVLIPNVTVAVSVVATNWLGGFQSASAAVAVAALPVPMISILGPKSMNVSKVDFVLSSFLSTSCGNAVMSGMQLTWTAAQINFDGKYPLSLNDSLAAVETVSQPQLLVHGAALALQQSYEFTVIATIGHQQSVSSASVTINVLPRPIVARIQGGDRNVLPGQLVIVDATSSLDPDNSDQTFGYLFACERFVDGISAGSCNIDAQLAVGNDVGYFNFTAGSLGYYVVNVTASKEPGPRSAQTSINIFILEFQNTTLDVALVPTNLVTNVHLPSSFEARAAAITISAGTSSSSTSQKSIGSRSNPATNCADMKVDGNYYVKGRDGTSYLTTCRYGKTGNGTAVNWQLLANVISKEGSNNLPDFPAFFLHGASNSGRFIGQSLPFQSGFETISDNVYYVGKRKTRVIASSTVTSALGSDDVKEILSKFPFGDLNMMICFNNGSNSDNFNECFDTASNTLKFPALWSVINDPNISPRPLSVWGPSFGQSYSLDISCTNCGGLIPVPQPIFFAYHRIMGWGSTWTSYPLGGSNDWIYPLESSNPLQNSTWCFTIVNDNGKRWPGFLRPSDTQVDICEWDKINVCNETDASGLPVSEHASWALCDDPSSPSTVPTAATRKCWAAFRYWRQNYDRHGLNYLQTGPSSRPGHELQWCNRSSSRPTVATGTYGFRIYTTVYPPQINPSSSTAPLFLNNSLVSTPVSPLWSWSIVQGQLAAGADAWLASITTKPTDVATLIIPAYMLLPGQTYLLSATAFVPSSSLTGSTTLMITTNDIPTSGSCSVDPQQGYGILTPFRLSCAGWLDPDLPLTFEWTRLSPATTSSTQPPPQIVSSRTSAAISTTLLGSGIAPSYQVVLQYKIYDSLGAVATGNFSVVSQPVFDYYPSMTTTRAVQDGLTINTAVRSCADFPNDVGMRYVFRSVPTLDGSYSRAVLKVFCNQGWQLWANMYDTARNDFPDDPNEWWGGWKVAADRVTGLPLNGVWCTGRMNSCPVDNITQSADWSAVVGFAALNYWLLEFPGPPQVRLCMTTDDGTADQFCIDTESGTLGWPAYPVDQSSMAAWYDDVVAGTNPSLRLLLYRLTQGGSGNYSASTGAYGVLEKGHCIPTTSSNANVWGTLGALCDMAHSCGKTASASAWSILPEGMNFRPWFTSNDEFDQCQDSFLPSFNGFRVYIKFSSSASTVTATLANADSVCSAVNATGASVDRLRCQQEMSKINKALAKSMVAARPAVGGDSKSTAIRSCADSINLTGDRYVVTNSSSSSIKLTCDQGWQLLGQVVDDPNVRDLPSTADAWRTGWCKNPSSGEGVIESPCTSSISQSGGTIGSVGYETLRSWSMLGVVPEDIRFCFTGCDGGSQQCITTDRSLAGPEGPLKILGNTLTPGSAWSAPNEAWRWNNLPRGRQEYFTLLRLLGAGTTGIPEDYTTFSNASVPRESCLTVENPSYLPPAFGTGGFGCEVAPGKCIQGEKGIAASWAWSTSGMALLFNTTRELSTCSSSSSSRMCSGFRVWVRMKPLMDESQLLRRSSDCVDIIRNSLSTAALNPTVLSTLISAIGECADSAIAAPPSFSTITTIDMLLDYMIEALRLAEKSAWNDTVNSELGGQSSGQDMIDALATASKLMYERASQVALLYSTSGGVSWILSPIDGTPNITQIPPLGSRERPASSCSDIPTDGDYWISAFPMPAPSSVIPWANWPSRYGTNVKNNAIQVTCKNGGWQLIGQMVESAGDDWPTSMGTTLLHGFVSRQNNTPITVFSDAPYFGTQTVGELSASKAYSSLVGVRDLRYWLRSAKAASSQAHVQLCMVDSQFKDQNCVDTASGTLALANPTIFFMSPKWQDIQNDIFGVGDDSLDSRVMATIYRLAGLGTTGYAQASAADTSAFQAGNFQLYKQNVPFQDRSNCLPISIRGVSSQLCEMASSPNLCQDTGQAAAWAGICAAAVTDLPTGCGCAFRPWRVDQTELACPCAANATFGVSVGFRIYLRLFSQKSRLSAQRSKMQWIMEDVLQNFASTVDAQTPAVTLGADRLTTQVQAFSAATFANATGSQDSVLVSADISGLLAQNDCAQFQIAAMRSASIEDGQALFDASESNNGQISHFSAYCNGQKMQPPYLTQPFVISLDLEELSNGSYPDTVSTCAYYDANGGAFSSRGCLAGPSSRIRVQCLCYHLSDFSSVARFLVPPLAPIQPMAAYRLRSAPLPFQLFLLVVIVMFIVSWALLSVVAHRRDMRELKVFRKDPPRYVLEAEQRRRAVRTQGLLSLIRHAIRDKHVALGIIYNRPYHLMSRPQGVACIHCLFLTVGAAASVIVGIFVNLHLMQELIFAGIAAASALPIVALFSNLFKSVRRYAPVPVVPVDSPTEALEKFSAGVREYTSGMSKFARGKMKASKKSARAKANIYSMEVTKPSYDDNDDEKLDSNAALLAKAFMEKQNVGEEQQPKNDPNDSDIDEDIAAELKAEVAKKQQQQQQQQQQEGGAPKFFPTMADIVRVTIAMVSIRRAAKVWVKRTKEGQPLRYDDNRRSELLPFKWLMLAYGSTLFYSGCLIFVIWVYCLQYTEGMYITWAQVTVLGVVIQMLVVDPLRITVVAIAHGIFLRFSDPRKLNSNWDWLFK